MKETVSGILMEAFPLSACCEALAQDQALPKTYTETEAGDAAIYGIYNVFSLPNLRACPLAFMQDEIHTQRISPRFEGHHENFRG